MTPQAMERQITVLGEGIRQRYMLLDGAGEAELRSERALLYTQLSAWHAAAEDMERVAELALNRGRTAEAAQANLLCGHLLAHDQTLWGDAAACYHSAALLYEEVGEWVAAAQTWQQVIAYWIQARDAEAVETTLRHAIALLNPATDSPLLTQLYATWGQWHCANGQYELAETVIQQAEAELGDAPEIQQLSQRQAILQGLVKGNLSLPQAWEQALPLLQAAGWVDKPLAQAMGAYQRGKWGKVVKFAAAARQSARASEEPMALVRYVMASMLLADAQDKQGHRVSVLVALLTCRARLASELGEEAGQSIDRVLDSLAERWGQDGLAQAVAGYQAYVAENGMVTEDSLKHG